MYIKELFLSEELHSYSFKYTLHSLKIGDSVIASPDFGFQVEVIYIVKGKGLALVMN